MTRSPDAWRRLVTVSGAVGLLLVVLGYLALDEHTGAFNLLGRVAFFGGFALVIAAVVMWYRHVPPRRPEPEGPPEDEEPWEDEV